MFFWNNPYNTTTVIAAVVTMSAINFWAALMTHSAVYQQDTRDSGK